MKKILLTLTVLGGLALATQAQIAAFFVSNGTKISDPNTPGLNYFEVPIKLPETLSFQ